jgi:Na+-driven multidrug efflux pump
MSNQNLNEGTRKQKAIHELKTVGWISLYLALFFCALSTYSMLMLHELNVTNSYFRYGFAIINALVLAKIILIGEYIRLGRKHESKPLILVCLYKAFLFSLLVVAFHILEETIKRFALHKPISVDTTEILIRNLVVFSFLVPFFAFWELRRVMGEGQLFDLFFRRREQSNPVVSSGVQKA